MGYPVVLTCDRTMASEYHGLMFLGFSACIPQGTIPDWIYYPLFCPSAPVRKNGSLIYANCGIRRIESALLSNGFGSEDIIVAHPDYLDKVIDSSTRILSVSSNDPLGIGPATTTFGDLWGGEARMAHKLRELLHHKAVLHHKPFVFLGGPGSWQLAENPSKQKELGIDCVVVGEGDVTAPKLFRSVLEGNREEIPDIVYGDVTPVEKISTIAGGTIIGLIEVTRGCARSCAFCAPSVRKVRSLPMKVILDDVRVNIEAGNDGVILHGEDMLLYQSDGLSINSDAVANLIHEVYSVTGVNFVGISHVSLSSIVSSPQTIKKMAEILELGTFNHPVNYYQVGIETGSPALIGKLMKGKVYPFKPEQWPDVVRDGFRISHENHFVCCATIILGLPGETPEDVRLTTQLVRSLHPYQSVIIPLFFTPVQTTRLQDQKPFTKKDLTPLHDDLLAACWEHNAKWFPELWKYYGRNKNVVLRKSVDFFLKHGIRFFQNRMLKDAAKRKMTDS